MKNKKSINSIAEFEKEFGKINKTGMSKILKFFLENSDKPIYVTRSVPKGSRPGIAGIGAWVEPTTVTLTKEDVKKGMTHVRRVIRKQGFDVKSVVIE